MTYTIAVCTVKTSDDGQRNCPKHVEFYSKNKFEKLVHLVGLIIYIYIYIYIYILQSSYLSLSHLFITLYEASYMVTRFH